jgi:hypothetical protein
MVWHDDKRYGCIMDELEPYWEEVDGLVQEKIRFVVAPAHFKHFDACRFKLKALWYINSRVEDLDLRYGQLVDSFLNQETYDRFVKGDDGSWSYFPFFEAVEFENLLTQSKACLDCFSKAVGSTFGELPNNVSALERVLRSKQSDNNRRTAQAEKLLQKIDEAKDRLTGIVLDPGNDGKKSIRDLVSHREHASIHFRITRAQQRSSNALINGAHPEIVRLPNYRVTEISETVWYHTKKLVEESLPLLL